MIDLEFSTDDRFGGKLPGLTMIAVRQNKFLISLISDDNDYQKEQAAAAIDAARRLDLTVEIVFAGNDAVTQTQQILNVMQDASQRPHAILVEPVGTAMDRIAQAATSAGIGWGIVNREADYVATLRRTSGAPIFGVSTDQEEVGRIQGRQFSALLKNNGRILYIEGPPTGGAGPLRTLGMLSTIPPAADVKVLRGDWTEQSAYHLMRSWLSLGVSRQLNIRVVGCQNDAMAIGVRKALNELPTADSNRWLAVPLTGCDGVARTGKEWVRRGLLAATVVISPNMGIAVEIMAQALHAQSPPPEYTITNAESFPPLEILGASENVNVESSSTIRESR
jgi:ABC-type sugar transport system substrate-binding protein